jgi:hypothetical protein
MIWSLGQVSAGPLNVINFNQKSPPLKRLDKIDMIAEGAESMSAALRAVLLTKRAETHLPRCQCHYCYTEIRSIQNAIAADKIVRVGQGMGF